MANWGLWDGNEQPANMDGLYISIQRLSHNGPLVYSVCGPGNDYGATITLIGWNSGETEADFIECSAIDDLICIRTVSGEKSNSVAGYPSAYAAPWNIRFRGESLAYDVVSFWWENAEVQKRYFMVQPMKSAQHDSALFIHGYNILTEI